MSSSSTITREQVHEKLIEAFGWNSNQIASLTYAQQARAINAANTKKYGELTDELSFDSLEDVLEYRRRIGKE